MRSEYNARQVDNRKSHYENVNGMHRNVVVPMMIHLGKHMLGQTEKSEANRADDID